MFSYWFSYYVFLESKEDGCKPYWRGDLEGTLDARIRTNLMNDSRDEEHHFDSFSIKISYKGKLAALPDTHAQPHNSRTVSEPRNLAFSPPLAPVSTRPADG